MAKQEARVARLKNDLKYAKALEINNSHFSTKELNAAKFGFCYALAPTDILYQMTCMSGRHDNIAEELERLIKSISEDGDTIT